VASDAPDTIQYAPDAGMRKLDPFKKVIRTAAGDFRFDDATFMGITSTSIRWKRSACSSTTERGRKVT
jgi:hypothetical protein